MIISIAVVQKKLFFPVSETGPAYDAQVADAKAVCAQCPVVAQCLTDALARIPDGIAGGLTADERRALRRRDRTAVAGAQRAVVAALRSDTTATTRDGGQAALSTRNRSAGRSAVNAVLTPERSGRAPRVVENAEFTAFGRRVVRAAGRRVAAGDVEALPALAALSAEVDAAITVAVAGLRHAGYSWAEIAARLGVTRQAAHQRWATTTDPTDASRGAVAS